MINVNGLLKKNACGHIVDFENLLGDNIYVDRQALVAQGECQLHAHVTSCEWWAGHDNFV